MSPIAIVMLVVSLVVVWGGLIAAILHLRSRPAVDEATLPPESADLIADDEQREHDAPLHRDT